MIGKTQTDNTTVGTRINGTGFISSVVNGDNALLLNRLNSDGAIITLRKDGTTIGSIGVDTNDNFVIEGNSTHSGFQFGTNTVLPHKNGALISSTISLGNPDYKFDSLHLSGGAFVGGNLVIDGLLKFEDSGGTDRTVIEYDSNDDLLIKTGTSTGARSIRFQTEASEVARFDASANLLIAKDFSRCNKYSRT